MDAAKAAISKFTSKQGHQTHVEESVGPAVTRETIKPHRHEEATQAVDREVHQHHHHTTVQPLSHQDTLPEKHTHNILPTEHREFRHDNEQVTKERVASDLAHFKNSSVTEQTRHSQSAAPTVTGEHVHHHVHETVIPMVHKETIQPEVLHTTVPIHETHHAGTQHHGVSALPMKSLSEFTNSGGNLTGGTRPTHESYDGAPREYNSKLGTTFEKLGLSGASHHRQTDSGIGLDNTHNGTKTAAGVGVVGATGAAGAANGRQRRGSASSSSSSESDVSNGGTRRRVKKNRAGKPSIMDRMNPLNSKTSAPGTSTGAVHQSGMSGTSGTTAGIAH